MRKTGKRIFLAGALLGLVVAIPGAIWVSLTHRPFFYQAMIAVPQEQSEVKAKRFLEQSLQLYNDINNEPTWEAVFSDQEVNAWLAADLVTEFADQLPPEVHEPRVVFELDRVTLAFELDRRPVKSVIWVVARPRVPKPNVLELTLEKIRAGVIPVPPEKVLDRIIEHVRAHGLDVEWKLEDDLPVVLIRYKPNPDRDDVQLDQVQIRDGEIRLVGRSNRSKGLVEAPTLPSRKVLQSKFPRRKIQETPGVPGPTSSFRRSASPFTDWLRSVTRT
jgi:hypothetical protein